MHTIFTIIITLLRIMIAIIVTCTCMCILYIILFIRGVKCNKLISLPRFVLLRIVSLLLSAAIIDKESNKVSQFTSCRKNVHDVQYM